MNVLLQTIDGVQEILAVCPCCGDLFRLVEAKFIFPQKRPKKSLYLDLVKFENDLSEQDADLLAKEENFKEKLESQREKIREQSRMITKNKLKKIDPTFSGSNIDPQDVRAILHPVEYITFHGLNSAEGVSCVEFVSRAPQSKAQEKMVNSIELTVRSGNISFETLHVQDDGTFQVRKA